MKKKSVCNKVCPLVEQEKFFAAKNKRRQWWKDHWSKFFELPFFIFIGGITIFIFFLAFTSGQVAILKSPFFYSEQKALKLLIQQEIEAHPSREVIHTYQYIYQEAPKPQLIYTNWFWPASTNYMGTSYATNILITNNLPKTFFQDGAWR